MFLTQLNHHLNAAYPAIWIQTFEEARITKEITTNLSRKATATDPGCLVFEWDIVTGLTVVKNDKLVTHKDTNDIAGLCNTIEKIIKEETADCVFVLKDPHAPLNSPLKGPVNVRTIRNLIPVLKVKRACLLMVSPVSQFPIELRKEITFLDFSLPSPADITQKLQKIRESANASRKRRDQPPLDLDPDIQEAAVDAARGMTDAEVENSLALAIVTAGKFDRTFVKTVFTEKVMQIKKGGLLNHLESDVSFTDVGGLDGVKRWVDTRKRAFSEAAREYKLPFPRGIGLAGIPGCGKTLISKGIANELGVPLYQLDLGGLFSKYVGETEGNFIQMTKTVDSIGRCVILID